MTIVRGEDLDIPREKIKQGLTQYLDPFVEEQSVLLQLIQVDVFEVKIDVVALAVLL